MKCVLFAAASSLILASSPGQAIESKVAVVGAWQIETVESAGRAESCRAFRRDGDLTFSFTKGAAGLGVSLSSSGWKLDRGATYRVTLGAGAGAEVEQAKASGANELEMTVSPGFVKSLDGMSQLDVKPVATSFRVPLARAPEALKALDDCWALQKVKVESAAVPTPAPGAPDAPASPSARTSAKPIALPATITLADFTALGRTAFGPSADIQQGTSDSYNIVQDDAVTIGRTATTSGPMNAIVVVIGEGMAQTCTAPASPNVTSLDVDGAVKLARLALYCTSASGPVQLDTTLLSDGKRVQIYSSIGPDKKPVIAAGERIYDELRKLYR